MCFDIEQPNLIFLDFYVLAFSLDIANYMSKFDIFGVNRGHLISKLNTMSLIAVKCQNPSSADLCMCSDKSKQIIMLLGSNKKVTFHEFAQKSPMDIFFYQIWLLVSTRVSKVGNFFDKLWQILGQTSERFEV